MSRFVSLLGQVQIIVRRDISSSRSQAGKALVSSMTEFVAVIHGSLLTDEVQKSFLNSLEVSHMLVPQTLKSHPDDFLGEAFTGEIITICCVHPIVRCRCSHKSCPNATSSRLGRVLIRCRMLSKHTHFITKFRVLHSRITVLLIQPSFPTRADISVCTVPCHE